MNGEPLGREHQLLAASVTKTVNRIAAARLIYLDGAAARGDFPLSDSDLLVPGAEVEILAGPAGDQTRLFIGILVRHAIKIRGHAAPQLIVDCRHRAVRLTAGPRNGYYLDQSDGDIIASILDAAGLDNEVEATTVTHKQQVQFNCTDWDYLLSRAEANGRMVLTNDLPVVVKTLDPAGAPICELRFGATILEMDGELDARTQYAAVKGQTWDPTRQELIEKDGADPGATSPGNLDSDTLAGALSLDHYHLQHPALSEEEAQAWADAQWLKSKLSRVGGRMKCEGIATVNPGDVVTLAGVGERFNGNALISGVRHDLDAAQGWKTHIQFGNLDRWLAREQPVSAPRAGALLPAVSGLQIGVVLSNEDPDGEHRVRVRMPLVHGGEDGAWARVASLDAGDGRGFFFRPEIGDEVVLGFLNDDPRQAVILGMLHSSAHPAPLEGSDDNHEKLYQSRAGLRLFFDDDKKIIRIETPAGKKITLDEDEGKLSIEDENSNLITMTGDGITIEAAQALTLKAGTELSLEAGTGFGMKGGTEVKVEGGAGVEITSSGITRVRGSMVQIN
ncbi:MAG: type VI secretion system tip protein VgrG [Thermodesulfobacteriota bacterium]